MLTLSIDEYIKELEDRRNFYKACSKEFDHLSKRIKWLTKIRDSVKEKCGTLLYTVLLLKINRKSKRAELTKRWENERI